MIGQASPTLSPAPRPIIDVSGTAAIWLIVGIAAGLVLAWAVPLFLEERRAFRAFKTKQSALIDKLLALEKDGRLSLTDDELAKIVTAATKRFEETTGLTRAVLAFAILSVLTVALVSVLVSSAADAPDLRKKIITALLSILATIVGFYFGAKTSETGQALGKEQTKSRQDAGPKNADGAQAKEGATTDVDS